MLLIRKPRVQDNTRPTGPDRAVSGHSSGHLGGISFCPSDLPALEQASAPVGLPPCTRYVWREAALTSRTAFLGARPASEAAAPALAHSSCTHPLLFVQLP